MFSFPDSLGTRPMIMASNVEARLKEREEARRAAAQQRKAERASGGRPEEAAGYFSQQFAAKKAGECVYKTERL